MDFKSLPSQYDHADAQQKWYPFWEQRGYFHAEADDRRPAFTIVIPPPNVTGALHLGHALNNTLQDILIRMKRMQGFNTLWMPGTDHAGIATQAVVERRLFEEQKLTRHELGREGLVERIWKWKDQYEARILSQLKQMGCSCDWQRTRFTLDDQCARAVREWFFRLFKDGKIYRGKRLVNWDTFLQTAVSDDEVFHEPVKGHFWHFKYPVIDPKPGEPTHVTIATTRPETMLGDTAVAVHPDPAAALDQAGAELREKLYSAPSKEKANIEAQMEALGVRRQAVLPGLIQLREMANRGVQLELPLTGRQIPLITDEWAKPELGSGCVKITPAHDANDYDVWQRHKEIGAISILNPDGTLNDNVPQKYRGLTVKKARDAVVANMEAAGLLVEVEDREIDLAHSDRSKTPIEPYLADQWFMKMDELAQSAMDAVTSGRVKITPERYAKGYLDWLSEKRDWPIGRQLWWGHRISIWSRHYESRYEYVGADLKTIEDSYQDELSDRLWSGQEVYDFVCVRFVRDNDETKSFKDEAPDSGGFTVYVCVRNQANEAPDVYEHDIVQLMEKLGFQQSEDVLDTWFSSALWPQSTLGWPDETPELMTFYPTSVLITSRDIITLWVARMVLAGLYNLSEVPFHEVYITPKILDGYGETMSKSKGNGVDPLDVIEKFGADALRFGLAYLTTDTQDVKLSVEFECPLCQTVFPQTKKNRQLPRIECEKCGQPFSTQWADKPEDKALPRGAVVSERFELGRNFANKLWNASRFSLINLEGFTPGPVDDKDLLLEDRWLLSRLATVTQQVTDLLEEYRYADAARTLYDFAWNEFCSFYVEMTKARFAVPEQRQTAQRVLAHALDVLLRLLHPMMPFLTEEVWQLLSQVAPTRSLNAPGGGYHPSRMVAPRTGARTPRLAAAESVCIAPWPTADTSRQDAKIEQQFADFQAVLGAVREIRQSQNIPPREEITFAVRCDERTAALLQPMQPYFTQMARAMPAAWGPDGFSADATPDRVISGQHGPIEVYVDRSRFIDVVAERKQREKERDNLAKQIASIDAKLANKNFVDKAPAEVVQQQRDKLAELRNQQASVVAALAKLEK
ncbi:MAG: valine--tRNA ligase [Planctomycetes bacterium]|nr:valine--tRNA ligase [Planctomycetota bacterium]